MLAKCFAESKLYTAIIYVIKLLLIWCDFLCVNQSRKRKYSEYSASRYLGYYESHFRLCIHRHGIDTVEQKIVNFPQLHFLLYVILQIDLVFFSAIFFGGCFLYRLFTRLMCILYVCCVCASCGALRCYIMLMIAGKNIFAVSLPKHMNRNRIVCTYDSSPKSPDSNPNFLYSIRHSPKRNRSMGRTQRWRAAMMNLIVMMTLALIFHWNATTDPTANSKRMKQLVLYVFDLSNWFLLWLLLPTDSIYSTV